MITYREYETFYNIKVNGKQYYYNGDYVRKHTGKWADQGCGCCSSTIGKNDIIKEIRDTLMNVLLCCEDNNIDYNQIFVECSLDLEKYPKIGQLFVMNDKNYETGYDIVDLDKLPLEVKDAIKAKEAVKGEAMG